MFVKFSTLIIVFAIVAADNDKGRIVGGWHAKSANDFPYIISLQRRGHHSCGGSILNSRWILTAAHCVANGDSTSAGSVDDFTVRAGSHIMERFGVVHKVRRIIIHHQYKNHLNDLALLELSQPLPMSNSIKSVPLQTGELPEGIHVLISGWGGEGNNTPRSQILKFNFLNAISRDRCRQLVGSGHPEIICLAKKANNGACFGDSGGPAVVNGRLVGVASYVLGGCGTHNPDGYVKVSHFVNWIRQNTK